MENIIHIVSHIWNVFVTSNAFNFAVFIAIFALIFKRFNLSAIIVAAQNKVADMIDDAKKARAAAKLELFEAEKSTANLYNELQSIIHDAEKSAKVIGEKIIEDAHKLVENIEQNTVKVIDAESKMLISKLTKTASKASVEVAKSHVAKALEQNPNLHDKYINESIDSLDKLNF